MKAILQSTIRDSRTGNSHRMGEEVTVIGSVKDPIRGLQLRVLCEDNTTSLVLPDEVKEI